MISSGLALPRGFYANRQKSRFVQTFDFIGSALLLAAAVLFVFALQQGGVGAFAWNSAVVVATLTIGCVSWFVLFAWEMDTVPEEYEQSGAYTPANSSSPSKTCSEHSVRSSTYPFQPCHTHNAADKIMLAENGCGSCCLPGQPFSSASL